MAPFPEAEDMTVKRLYVALKRDDMQLLQMGAHKLHEKYHTGYKFQLLDDLRQILSYVEEQEIPNDIKELLTKTINDILSNKEPESSLSLVNQPEEENKFSFKLIKNSDETNSSEMQPKENEITPVEPDKSSSFTLFQNPSSITSLSDNSVVENSNTTSKDENETSFEQDSVSDESYNNKEEEPVIFTPKDAAINMVNSIDETPVQANVQNFDNSSLEKTSSFKLISENELTLNNVAVFYDDKAPFIDYFKNKSYRLELDSLALNKDANPIVDAPIVKSTVDVQTDEYAEILKMLNTIKGDVYFVTTSKSDDLLKTFVDLNINFKIKNVSTKQVQGKEIEVIPLFGLSNIFYCPKCGKKETIISTENKILTALCSECNGVMYPNLYEALNYESNADVFNFLSGISAMSKAETWILINPPLEGTRALTSLFLKTAFESSKPKKVYILSKETTKKEYYRQMFLEINPSVEIKTDFTTEDALCEEFINSEMSTVKVNA